MRRTMMEDPRVEDDAADERRRWTKGRYLPTQKSLKTTSKTSSTSYAPVTRARARAADFNSSARSRAGRRRRGRAAKQGRPREIDVGVSIA